MTFLTTHLDFDLFVLASLLWYFGFLFGRSTRTHKERRLAKRNAKLIAELNFYIKNNEELLEANIALRNEPHRYKRSTFKMAVASE
jgi:hypothetical protein